VWNSVRNAFRKQAGWAKLQEARAEAAKHWTERVWYHHNQRWLQASREGTEASKSGSCKDEREWGKKCFEDLDQRRMGRPVTRTWSTDFLLREGSSREEIGQWLKNKSIPWQRRRSLLQFVTHPLRSRLVVSRSTCPPLSPSPHAKSFVVGPAVINTHTGAQRMGSRAGDESVLSCQ
jgi:hypothetical protein